MKYKLYLGSVGFTLERPLTRWEQFRAWLAGWRYVVVNRE